MNQIKFSELRKREKELIEKALDAAKHSVSKSGHMIGCAILCKNGEVFVGATNARSRAIGSTCAERMAVDQLYFHGYRSPILVVLTGVLKRSNLKNSSICTPCGVCLEMFWELIMDLKIKDLNFICSSWNKKRILKVKFTELYPRIEAVRR